MTGCSGRSAARDTLAEADDPTKRQSGDAVQEFRSFVEAADRLALFSRATGEWLRLVADKLRQQGVGLFASYLEGQVAHIFEAKRLYDSARCGADAVIEGLRPAGTGSLVDKPATGSALEPGASVPSIFMAEADIFFFSREETPVTSPLRLDDSTMKKRRPQTVAN